VVLKLSGELVAIQDARITAGTKRVPRQTKVLGDTKPSGSGINPCILWDNTGYMLGYQPEDQNPDRTARSFDAFRDQHLELESELDAPVFSAVCAFLKRWDPAEAQKHQALEEVATGFGVFQISGETAFVHDDPIVTEWWHKHHIKKGGGPVGQCLLTGNRAAIARLQPTIKGVKDSKMTAKLVSFNERAYESYGKVDQQGLNAPVSEDAAYRYGTALNALLDGPMRAKHRLLLADTTVAFWTTAPSAAEDIFAEFAISGSNATGGEPAQDPAVRQKLESFINALRKGREVYGELATSPDSQHFCMLGLAPNAARLGVRFFHRGTLGELLDNLRCHFSDIRIARQFGEKSKYPDPEFPSIKQLLDETAPLENGKPNRDKIPPILAGPLLRAVLTKTLYPHGLYLAVVGRIRADRVINYCRACIVKGYLTRNLKQEVSMSLDPDRTDPAYRFGRLFAAVEKTQEDALGKVNASVRDRFYSAASATPVTVFPRLLRTYQHHLAKLEGGLKVNREKLLQEIMAPLDVFSSHLSLSEQGIFAIGYYHQRQDFFTKKPETNGE